MLAVRKIVEGEKLMTIMDLPKEMQRGQVEVIVLPVSTHVDNAKSQVNSMRGFLSAYANPDLIPLEEGAWERHVVEKHANP